MADGSQAPPGTVTLADLLAESMTALTETQVLEKRLRQALRSIRQHFSVPPAAGAPPAARTA